ncbi:hypothetical protein [Streptomyces sp. LaBMicrA B280]|uniref:hypothetical protein n=1 Tax=Streptomyces sp. LaBMicrA B280 TaxID=3391001 RepID=UPI003BA7FDA7
MESWASTTRTRSTPSNRRGRHLTTARAREMTTGLREAMDDVDIAARIVAGGGSLYVQVE